MNIKVWALSWRTVLLAALALGAVRCQGAPWIEVDLASETAWTARLDEGPPRAIQVPGGGWNSDVQRPPIQVLQDVRDFVLYERRILIPHEASGGLVKVLFGAVNYGAEVYLEDRKVAEHHGPMMPFEADLTRFVDPDKEYVLRVKAYHRRHYIHGGRAADVPVGFDFPRGRDPASLKEGLQWFADWNGQSRFAYGITKYVKLQVLPPLFVQDVFVRPSVTRGVLASQAWIVNSTDVPRRVKLSATLSPWNGRSWNYPRIPDTEAEIPARGVLAVNLEPVPWKLGPESYWWPNIPFREDYAAELHFLNLKLSEGAHVWDEKRLRFGFVEHAEGPFYYTVNGVRVAGFSDATTESQTSYFDAYSRAPAWLPPTRPHTGCPETWRRYLRAGMNCNRICCSMPTEYMMETADEAGFMLIPEAPIWGNGVTRFHPDYTPQCIREMVRACRNHPSVARYSLANEPREPIDAKWPWRPLIDAAAETDGTRPCVFELEKAGNGRIDGVKAGHAYIMEHYVPIGYGGGFIHGMGEHVWGTDGMESLAVTSRQLRLNDWAYFAPWSWINFWPNFLEGMNHDLHAWKPNDHADRVDGVDGWGSPPVRAVQQSLHPYLVLDRELVSTDPWDLSGILESGAEAGRDIEMFNGGLKPGRFQLKWSAHWDKPGNDPVLAGTEPPLAIDPGFHAARPLSFKAPAVPAGVHHRELYLVLRSFLGTEEVFMEDRFHFQVVDADFRSRVQFLGADDRTRGTWRRGFGRDGRDIVGLEAKPPAYARSAWAGDHYLVFSEKTDDPRALETAVEGAGEDRIAAVRYGKPLMRMTVDVGDSPRRLSLYFLDWADEGLRSDVVVRGPDGVVLDRRTVAEYRGGKYLSWNVRGRVECFIHRGSVAGVFFDPPEVR